MFRFVALFTAFSFGIVGAASANQPLDLNLKLKVEGAIDRVDMGVWASCTISQRVPVPLTDIFLQVGTDEFENGALVEDSAAIQILEPGEIFIPTENDGTLAVTLRVPLNDSFKLERGNRAPEIKCKLAKGLVEQGLIADTNSKLFLQGDTLISPAITGSCPEVSVKYDFRNHAAVLEESVCK